MFSFCSDHVLDPCLGETRGRGWHEGCGGLSPGFKSHACLIELGFLPTGCEGHSNAASLRGGVTRSLCKGRQACRVLVAVATGIIPGEPAGAPK